jgi:hypothetical protein
VGTTGQLRNTAGSSSPVDAGQAVMTFTVSTTVYLMVNAVFGGGSVRAGGELQVQRL